MKSLQGFVNLVSNIFGGARSRVVFAAVKQIDLVELMRDIIWAAVLAFVVVDTFLIYVAFGGHGDFGAIIAGMVGCTVIVFCAGELADLLWRSRTAFKLMAIAAMWAATLLVACGTVQYLFPHQDWFQAGLLPVFLVGFAFAFVNIYVVLPLFIHKSRVAQNMLHQSMNLFWHRLTRVLGAATTVAMLGFGGYFIYTAVGGFLESVVHMILAYAVVVVCGAGVILYGLHWEKILRLPVNMSLRSVEALATALMVLTLVLLDVGIWNSLHMFAPVSSVVSWSDRIVFIGIIVLFDTTILFAAPWWGYTWSNRRSTLTVNSGSATGDGFSEPPAELDFFNPSTGGGDERLDQQDEELEDFNEDDDEQTNP
ncbi:MAG: hypothetical protein JST89_24310 [Cyanobacteria bacterium SZAS-4]|nr:hypothetical protein [Cyanobacteria bacterium SZAS-4]